MVGLHRANVIASRRGQRSFRRRHRTLRRSGNFFALFRRGFGNLLRFTHRRNGLAVLRLRRADIVAARRRQGLFRGALVRRWLRNFGLRGFRLHLLLLAGVHSAIEVLLRSLINRRCLIPSLVAVIRLLIIPLLISAGRRQCVVTPLLIDRPLLVRPGVSALVVVAADILRLPCFANDLANRARRESFARGALDGIHAGTSIGKYGSLMAIKINRLAVKIFDDRGPINDRGVIHYEITPAMEIIPETVHITEGEE